MSRIYLVALALFLSSQATAANYFSAQHRSPDSGPTTRSSPWRGQTRSFCLDAWSETVQLAAHGPSSTIPMGREHAAWAINGRSRCTIRAAPRARAEIGRCGIGGLSRAEPKVANPSPSSGESTTNRAVPALPWQALPGIKFPKWSTEPTDARDWRYQEGDTVERTRGRGWPESTQWTRPPYPGRPAVRRWAAPNRRPMP